MDYAAAPGINASLLKLADGFSMAHVKATMDGTRKHESDAMDFGKCFHSLLLEDREDFVERPDTYPAPPHHAKVKSGEIEEGAPLKWTANAQYCSLWESSQGKLIMNMAEVRQLRGMVASLRSSPELSEYLDGQCELSVFAEKDGYPVKCRMDLLTKRKDGPVIDFKSARCAQPSIFLNDAFNRGYHIQAAWNLDVGRWAGIERRAFWCAAVESEEPYAHCILKFNDETASFLRYGRTLCRAAFQRIKNCTKSGVWPAYGAHDAETHAKPWMLPMLDQTS